MVGWRNATATSNWATGLFLSTVPIRTGHPTFSQLALTVFVSDLPLTPARQEFVLLLLTT